MVGIKDLQLFEVSTEGFGIRVTIRSNVDGVDEEWVCGSCLVISVSCIQYCSRPSVSHTKLLLVLHYVPIKVLSLGG